MIMEHERYERRIQTVCLFILSVVAVTVALYWLKPVLIPFVLAIFLVIGLNVLVDVQKRYLRIPRLPAIFIALVVTLVVLAGLAALVSQSVTQLADNADLYGQRVVELTNKAAAILPLEKMNIDPEVMGHPMSYVKVDMVRDMLVNTTNSILGVLSNGALVLIFVCFLLFGSNPPQESGKEVRDELELRIKRYIIAKVLISIATGVFVGAILYFLGIELALGFGLLAFLLNFIPSIGSVIATILPLPMVLLSPEVTTTTAVLAIVLPGGLQFLIGTAIEPKVMGQSLDLHPVVVLMALMFWGMLWGIVGMFLAVPITAIMKILFERTEFTQPLARLLAGRLDMFNRKA
jgi:AI-2 transport protein TqsA